MKTDQIYQYARYFEKLAIADFPPLMAEEISRWVKKKYLEDLRKNGINVYEQNFKIDTELSIFILDTKYHSILPVKLIIDDNENSAGGCFYLNLFSLEIYISRKVDKTYNLEMIDIIIEHELAHMMQMLLMLNKKQKTYEHSENLSDDFNKWYKNNPIPEASLNDNIMYLRRTELQPYLLSAVRMFIQQIEFAKTGRYSNLDYINFPITKQDFDIFVGNPEPVTEGRLTTFPIFAKLYQYDFERWKKAVKEFWKTIKVYVDRP